MTAAGGRGRKRNLGKERSVVGDERTNGAVENGAVENGAVEAIDRPTHWRDRANALWKTGGRGSIRLSLSAARGEENGYETHLGD